VIGKRKFALARIDADERGLERKLTTEGIIRDEKNKSFTAKDATGAKVVGKAMFGN
jgi:hypothetical protein